MAASQLLNIKFRSFILTLALAGVVLATIVVLVDYFTKLNPPVFGIVFCYLFVCLVLISTRLNRGKLVIYCSAYVFLALGIADLFHFRPYKAPSEESELVFTDAGSGQRIQYYHISDPDLGYANEPNRTVSATRRSVKDGAIIYDVKYTIDERGLRKTLLKNTSPGDHAVWFFGDSFAFGEGVNDDDALPQQFATISGHCAANFAVSGYGPHEMLRALEIGLPEKLNLKNPLAIVYVVIPEYVASRAAGLAPWDQKGPRYEVIDGQAKYVGTFSETRSELDRIASKSDTYTAVFRKYPEPVDSEPDQKRFTAIMLKAQELSLRKYHAPFIALLWDVWVADWPKAEWIAQSLKDNQILTLRLSTTLPDLNKPDAYIPIDGHPNGKAHAAVAHELNSFLAPYLTPKSPGAKLSSVRLAGANSCH